ncbi:MAG: SipW-dependent-type signal peptide-containing protein [Nakamurella sp.]
MRSRVALVVAGLVFGVLALLSTAPTSASWNDREYAKATFRAATVNPPRTLVCAASGLLTNVRLTWTVPATGGAGYTAYTYAIVPLSGSYPPGSGTIAAGTTTFTLPGTFLSALGTGRFELRAFNATYGWSSVAVTATVGTTIGVVSTCSVP